MTTLAGHGSSVTAIAFSPAVSRDRAEVATGSLDGIARTWDAVTGRPPATLRGHSGDVTAVAFAPDGSLLATASDNRTARVWDPLNGTPLRTLGGHDSWVKGVAFGHCGGLIATGSWDQTARIWDAATGACLATLVPLPSGGHITLLPDTSYKLQGDPGDCLWRAAGLRRLGPADVGSRFPDVHRLPPSAPLRTD